MRQQHGILATAVVAAALLACSGDDTDSTVIDPLMPAVGDQPPAGNAAPPAMPGQNPALPGQNPAMPGANPAMPGGQQPPADDGVNPAMPGGQQPPADDGTDPTMPSPGQDDPAGGDDPGDDGAGAPGAGSCGPEVTTAPGELGNTDKLGPYTPTHVEQTGPSGSSWIYHPEELGQDGMKHPIFQWGPGAGTGPSQYLDHLNLLASHGFVIISQSSTQSGKQALTWILEQNETEGSMWYQKLDPERVGRGGHSMGALQSMSEADDERLMLYVLVCGGAGGNGGASDIDDPVIFLGGEGLGDTRNFEGDYAEVTGPAVFIRHGDTDHIYCARDNLGPWVAFMRWQFCGEEKWKQEFEPGGAYCMGEWADCETKNL